MLEDILQCVLHTLCHADLTTNVNISALPTNKEYGILREEQKSKQGLVSTMKNKVILESIFVPYPVVIDLSSISSQEILYVLLGLVGLPGKGYCSRKLETCFKAVVVWNHSPQEPKMIFFVNLATGCYFWF